MKKIASKLHSRSGFTLIELVCTLLIVALVGAAVAAGCQMAPRVYRDSTFTSESIELEDTLRVALGDMLRSAAYKGTSDGDILIVSSGYGMTSGSLLVSDGKLMFYKDVSHKDALIPLINAGMYSDISMTGFSISYDDARHVFRGSYTLQSSGSDALEREVEFAFRSVYTN